MARNLSAALRRHRVLMLMAAFGALMSFWPASVAPIGSTYVAFCARFLSGTPFGHRLPPYMAALLYPVLLLATGGTLCALARQLRGQQRLDAEFLARRYVLSPRRQAILARLGVSADVMCVRDERLFVFCGRLIAPRIYLSSGFDAALTDNEFEAALLHERRHLRRRDPLRFFIVDLGRHFEPLCPVLRTIIERAHVNAELAADRDATDASSPDVLASALLKVMRAHANPTYGAATAALSPTDARIAALCGRPIDLSLGRRDLAISLGYALGIAVLLGLLVLRAPAPPMLCRPCVLA